MSKEFSGSMAAGYFRGLSGASGFLYEGWSCEVDNLARELGA